MTFTPKGKQHTINPSNILVQPFLKSRRGPVWLGLPRRRKVNTWWKTFIRANPTFEDNPTWTVDILPPTPLSPNRENKFTMRWTDGTSTFHLIIDQFLHAPEDMKIGDTLFFTPETIKALRTNKYPPKNKKERT